MESQSDLMMSEIGVEHCYCKRKLRAALCMIRAMNASFDEALYVCVRV